VAGGRPDVGGEEKRLAVSGTGQIEVRPDVMEISATVTASGELTNDVLRNFRANRRRGVRRPVKN